MGKKYLNYVDEEKQARKAGFRNFISFACMSYYCKNLSLKDSGKIIGISATKVKSSLIKRGFELRKPGPLPGTAPLKKRKVDVWAKTREYTPFMFPWCAFYIYYEKYFLTSHEISKIMKISQPLVCKFLRKYNIPVRKQGTRKIRRKDA